MARTLRQRQIEAVSRLSGRARGFGRKIQSVTQRAGRKVRTARLSPRLSKFSQKLAFPQRRKQRKTGVPISSLQRAKQLGLEDVLPKGGSF